MGIFGKLFEKNEKPQDLLCNYGVTYKGGHPDYPKEKIGEIEFFVCSDRFELHPTIGTKNWFKGFTIPFNAVYDLQIVQRQVGSVEGILGGLDSRQLNQANNIHIKYNLNGQEVLLRLEMLSGITVMGQAKKCLELEDRLRNGNVRSKFIQISKEENIDIASQLEKLAVLHEKGILTKEEFDNKKKDLLAKM